MNDSSMSENSVVNFSGISPESIQEVFRLHCNDKNEVIKNSIKYLELIEFLKSYLNFSEDLYEVEKDEAIATGLAGTHQGNFNKFLELVSAIQGNILIRPDSNYIVVTTIVLPPGCLPKDREIEGCKVKFGLQIHDAIDGLIAEEIGNLNQSLDLPRLSIHAKPMKLFVTSRSPEVALEKGERIARFVRGLWTYLSTFNLITYGFGIDRAPLSPFPIGPITSVYNTEGTCPTGTFYRDFEYPFGHQVNLNGLSWDGLEALESTNMEQLSKVSYADEMFEIFCKYGASLSYKNYNLVILPMWALLEKLSGVNPGTPHEKIVKRVSAVSALKGSYLYHTAQLRAFKQYRNNWTHQSLSDERAWWIANRLKCYVETMISFHLHVGNQIADISECGRYLDKLELKVKEGKCENCLQYIAELLLEAKEA